MSRSAPAVPRESEVALGEAPLAAERGVIVEIPVGEVQVQSLGRIVTLTDPRSPGADRFRYLGMRLRELRETAKLRTLVVTSPLPRDGKTTIALNLATTLATIGNHSVLLIEADLHCPTVAKNLGIEPRPGLAECLEQGLDPVTALQRVEPLGWHLLHAGTPISNPTELLQSELVPRIVQTLSSRFDWVVIDAPPVAPLTDAVSLSRHADATLLVVRAGRTPRESVEEALAAIGRENVAGIVFNADDQLNHHYSKYRGYYGKP
jgi:capsular exopolysaccharide synthesis family protein